MHLIRQLVVRNRSNVRSFMRCARLNVSATKQAYASTETATQSTEAAYPPPPPEGQIVPANPKLVGIVNDIAKLNLLEVSELSALLKKTLNLPDAPVVSYAAGAAPAAAAAEEEEVAPKITKTAFKVKLMAFDDKQKIALIKEIKSNVEGMNLVQAKKFVESCPAFVREDIPKEDADKLKEVLEKVGAKVEIS